MPRHSIKLTGKAAKKYDVYCCIHSADYGWLGWAKNGETAGTTGGAVRAEAIMVRLVEEGLLARRQRAGVLRPRGAAGSRVRCSD